MKLLPTMTLPDMVNDVSFIVGTNLPVSINFGTYQRIPPGWSRNSEFKFHSGRKRRLSNVDINKSLGYIFDLGYKGNDYIFVMFNDQHEIKDIFNINDGISLYDYIEGFNLKVKPDSHWPYYEISFILDINMKNNSSQAQYKNISSGDS
jgi:hypothetical protein